MKSKSWFSNLFSASSTTDSGGPRSGSTRINGRILFAGNIIERPIITINETGCMVGVESLADIPEVFDLAIDFQDAHFKSQAKRIRLSESPPGIGLSFLNLTADKKTELNKIIKAWNSSNQKNL